MTVRGAGSCTGGANGRRRALVRWLEPWSSIPQGVSPSATPLPGARPQGVREGLQSFPMLLLDGRPAPLLCDPTASLDRTHRDIRFAIGTRGDGHVLLALTRYEGVGSLSARLPVGPTTHETAELMRRLGAQQALMLDGGLSAQLLVREGTATHRWEGMRRVPLAVVGKRIP